MMEKAAWAGEGRGCTPNPFHSNYHHIQSCSERSSWEGRYTPPISSLPLYVLCGFSHKMFVGKPMKFKTVLHDKHKSAVVWESRLWQLYVLINSLSAEQFMHLPRCPCSFLEDSARIWERIRNPGIDAKESISSAYVAWRVVTSNRDVVPVRFTNSGSGFRFEPNADLVI